MADKTYKMTVTLSDGNTVDAGTFVAPEGPQGPAGTDGGIGDLVAATVDTVLADGLYLITINQGFGQALVNISGGTNSGFSIVTINEENMLGIIYLGINEGKISRGYQTCIINNNGTLSFQQVPVSLKDVGYNYIKLK